MSEIHPRSHAGATIRALHAPGKRDTENRHFSSARRAQPAG